MGEIVVEVDFEVEVEEYAYTLTIQRCWDTLSIKNFNEGNK